MKLLMLTVLFTAALASTLSAQENASEEPVELKVGDLAPDFELPGTDGKKHRLSEFRNKKWVVVAWYPMALTPG